MEKNSDKYDRQIRLWGVDGQREIEKATIVCFGSDSVSAEILKNLVLHAFGKIIIIDDAVVNENDIGINFMVEEESIGKNRAEEVKRLLNEINPDPTIIAEIKDPYDYSYLIAQKEVLGTGAFVITQGNLPNAKLSELSDIIRSLGMKQLHIQTTGFYGAFYLDAGYHHSFAGLDKETIKDDLRIHHPFPELKDFFDSFDVQSGSMPDKEFSEIPYPVFLYNARQNILKEVGAGTKITFSHLSKLNAELSKMNRECDPGNLDEAKKNCIHALDVYQLPSNIESLFETIEKNDYPEDDEFWILVKATKEFYEKNGVIPHWGKIGDMDSSSAVFNQLKGIYQRKCVQDIDELAAMVPNIEKSHVEHFVKNIRGLKAVAYKPIKESVVKCGTHSSERRNIVRDMFIADRIFKEKNGRDPVLEDKDKFIEIMKELGTKGDVNDYVAEFVRFNGEILPSVSTTLASLAAQEITKVIIMKATPCQPVVVYDALNEEITEGY